MPTGCSAGRWTHRKGITDEPFTTFEMALVHRPLACKRAFARRCRLGDTDGTSPRVTRQWEISESSLMKTVSPTDLRLAALHHEDKVKICRTRHLDGFLVATIHHWIDPKTILERPLRNCFQTLVHSAASVTLGSNRPFAAHCLNDRNAGHSALSPFQQTSTDSLFCNRLSPW